MYQITRRHKVSTQKTNSIKSYLINFPLLLSKYGQQQLCVAENGEVGDSAQLIFKPHEPLECEQN